jgi:hypothetical protein
MVLGLKFGYKYFDMLIPCQVFGFLMQVFFRLEILMVCVLSLYRYLMVFFKFERGIKFWVLVLVVLSIPSITIFSYGAAIKDYRPTLSYIQCLPYFRSDKFSTTMLLITSSTYMFPCLTTSFCYFAVGWRCNKHLNLMINEARSTQDINGVKLIRQQKIKLYLQLALVFFIYNLLFMLSYITMILKFAIDFKRTPVLDGLILSMINFSVCLNPIVTVFFQPEVNSEFLFLLVTTKAKFRTFFKDLFRI